jgi:hypothetical protein
MHRIRASTVTPQGAQSLEALAFNDTDAPGSARGRVEPLSLASVSPWAGVQGHPRALGPARCGGGGGVPSRSPSLLPRARPPPQNAVPLVAAGPPRSGHLLDTCRAKVRTMRARAGTTSSGMRCGPPVGRIVVELVTVLQVGGGRDVPPSRRREGDVRARLRGHQLWDLRGDQLWDSCTCWGVGSPAAS